MAESLRSYFLIFYGIGILVLIATVLPRLRRPPGVEKGAEDLRRYIPVVFIPLNWLLPPALILTRVGGVGVDWPLLRLIGLLLSLYAAAMLLSAPSVLGRFLVPRAVVFQDHELVTRGRSLWQEGPGVLGSPRGGAVMNLDHLILRVNDRQTSVRFYTEVLGLVYEGEREPFSVVRVTPDFTIQLAPWGTTGGEHLAFSMSASEFEEVFRRIRESGIGYGDSFHSVGNMKRPGRESGARGPGASLYCFDPNKHLVEIRHYE